MNCLFKSCSHIQKVKSETDFAEEKMILNRMTTKSGKWLRIKNDKRLPAIFCNNSEETRLQRNRDKNS